MGGLSYYIIVVWLIKEVGIFNEFMEVNLLMDSLMVVNIVCYWGKVEFIKGVVGEVDWIFYFMSFVGGGGGK